MMSREKGADILLVEDNPNDAELALRSLEKHNLVNGIDWVKDGAEALDYIFARGQYEDRAGINPPRVIFLDLRLPKVDGLEVLREIRTHDETEKIPVVILTSSKEDRDITEAYKYHVNSYISKPVNFGDFSKTVADLGFYWLFLNKPPVQD